MAKTSKKMDFKKIALNALAAGGAGVLAQVISEAVSATNTDIVDYGMLAIGVALPELVKGSDMVETGAAGLVAVAGYRLSERYDLGGKIGITKTTTTATTTVTGTRENAIGSPWAPDKTYAAKKVKVSGADVASDSAVK